jgi:hypothetical protein
MEDCAHWIVTGWHGKQWDFNNNMTPTQAFTLSENDDTRAMVQ